jgi:hypothetical protein
VTCFHRLANAAFAPAGITSSSGSANRSALWYVAATVEVRLVLKTIRHELNLTAINH